MRSSYFALLALSLSSPLLANSETIDGSHAAVGQAADRALDGDTIAWDFVEGITTEVGPRQAGTEAEKEGGTGRYAG